MRAASRRAASQALSLALGASVAGAQSYPLHDSFLPGPTVEDVRSAITSADGAWTLYHTTTGRLFSLPPASGGALELTEPGVLCGSSSTWTTSLFEIGPGNATVVLVVDGPGSDDELYSVPSDGSVAPVKLDTPATLSFDLFRELSFTPDGSTVLFLRPVRSTVGGGVPPCGLFRVPIDGSSAPVKLSPNSPSEDVREYTLLPGRGLVALLSDRKLYSKPFAGGAAVLLDSTVEFGVSVSPNESHVLYQKLSGSYSHAMAGGAPVLLGPGGSLGTIRSSPLSDRVVFASDGNLYSRPIDGSGSLAQLTPSGGFARAFEITPDGSRVVCWGDPETDDVFEIFSVPIDGSSAPVKISLARPLHPDPYIYGPVPFRLAPDGSHVAYFGFDGGTKLYSASVTGGAALVTLAASGPGQNFLGDAVFAAGGERLVYRAGFGDKYGETWELMSVPADGSAAPVRISQASIFDFNGGTAFVGGDDDFAHYLADSGGNTVELYRTSVDASSAPVVINGPLLRAPFADVSALVASPPTGRVLYLADDRADGRNDLYSVARDGSEPPVRLNTFTGVTGFVLSADGEQVVHRYTSSGPSSERLHGSRIDGSELIPLTSQAKVISPFAITPDGTRVVYAKIDTLSVPFELFVVPLDGSAAPLKISQPMGSLRHGVQSFRVSQDSSTVVYVADAITLFVDALFGAPLDGSAAPVRLSPPLASGGNVLADGYFVSASNRVVFRADQAVDEQFELFSAPLDTAGSSVRLNPTLVAGGNVLAAFDAQRAVFVADALVDERFELFSAPLDGSAAAIVLSGALDASADVDPASVRVSANGDQTVFLADAFVNGVDELFGAPVDGSAAATRLAPGLDVAVASLVLDPTGSFALFGSGGALYRVPLDGSSAPVALAMPVGSSLAGTPLLAPDQGSVVYPASLASNREQLLRATLDGSGPALAVDEPLPEGSFFQFVTFSSNASRLAYVADQEETGTLELFGALLPAQPRARRR